ncbi:LON peptidase substrate-binding domain-containing protein [Tumebacillus lipolyticus]|uniref:LON peptidase substrate-binding domain-containing protein n=1 Tax=Tumebacillus lipolyticus TaxID=1280370 RepID=A0ABW4ZYU8_9BACL
MSTYQLQLFPLHTVLYPQGSLPLHIFEPRYRTMIEMCVEHDVPFGVVQIISGHESGGRATTAEVGTVARIENLTRLEDGRMLITTRGEGRFRILTSSYDGECLTAMVEPYEDEPAPEHVLVSTSVEQTDLGTLFQRYYKLLSIALHYPYEKINLPSDPVTLSWLIPSFLHIQPELKQAILLNRNLGKRLELVRELLEEETEKLAEMIREAQGK